METDDPIVRMLMKAEDHYAEFMQQIGRISTSFAGIEANVIYVLSLLVNDKDPEIGEIVADKMTYTQSVELLSKLASRPNPLHRIADLTALIKRLGEAGTRRNELIHAVAAIVPSDDGQVSLSKVRRRYVKKSQEDTHIKDLDDIRATMQFLDDLRRDMEALRMRMLTEDTEQERPRDF